MSETHYSLKEMETTIEKIFKFNIIKVGNPLLSERDGNQLQQNRITRKDQQSRKPTTL